MKKKILLIFMASLLIFVGCSQDADIENVTNIDVGQAETETTQAKENTPEAAATVDATPEPTPFVMPDKPKYIFIVIGDGMGEGGASYGEIYARLEAESMDAGAVWESFDVKKIVDAMLDSSSGGTALSTGYKTQQGYLGITYDEESLYTIMDRAKENDYGTGVITNSSLADGTPASFTAHTLSRYRYADIIAQTTESNVDFLAGGGLRFFGHESEISGLPKEDCYGISTYYWANEVLTPELEKDGYSLYYGKDGGDEMLNKIKNDNYPYEKAIYSMSLVYMPWEIDKYRAVNAGDFESVPTLGEMTQTCMETLVQNDNGFVMMVEEAFIDKASHMESMQREIFQVKLLNETMKTIMEFYEEHPYETLVILTADHECGGHLYNEELFSQISDLPDFKWSDDGDELSEFLQSEWDFHDFESYYHSAVANAQKECWTNEEDARAMALGQITETLCKKYGTQMTHGFHSRQDVPLYVIGNNSEYFEDCAHIAEIPIKICEIMGWKALPEIVGPEE